jgi:tetratricopeptide (TPR) repeat protein
LSLSIKTWTQVGHWQNNITLYDHALKVTDHNWLAYNNRGIAYAGLGNYRQAIEDFSREIEIMGRANAYYNRGHAYYDLGNYRKAIEDYNKAIEIKPDYEDAYINRGAAYARLGDINLSINDFKIAAKLGSERAKNFLKNEGISW